VRFLALAAIVILALWAVDRVALALEARGWIYWRRRRASPRSVGAAALELHALLEPDRRHGVETLQGEELETEGDESGDPPSSPP